jgi:pyruvate formate lyase activating enzyme
MRGTIFNIMRYSVNDGPGIRTTVFLKGCPLHCKWCHNPEALARHREIIFREDRCLRCGDCVAVCQGHATRQENGRIVIMREQCIQCGHCIEVCCAAAREMAGQEMATAEVMAEISKDVVFFDASGGGVTFSGGEPLLQHKFLLSLLQACKQKGIHTAVDTAGYASPAILARISAFVDLFLYDLKTLDDAKHREFTGVSNRLILENLQRLSRWRKNVIVRMPLIPGANDDAENIRLTGRFVASLGNINEMQVLPYHQTGIKKYCRLGLEYALQDLMPPAPESLQQIANELKRYVKIVAIGG